MSSSFSRPRTKSSAMVPGEPKPGPDPKQTDRKQSAPP